MSDRIKALPYREGTWFAVQLRMKGYAIGVVARMNGEGAVVVQRIPLVNRCALDVGSFVLAERFFDRVEAALW